VVPAQQAGYLPRIPQFVRQWLTLEPPWEKAEKQEMQGKTFRGTYLPDDGRVAVDALVLNRVVMSCKQIHLVQGSKLKLLGIWFAAALGY